MQPKESNLWAGNDVFHAKKEKSSHELQSKASQSQAGDQIHAVIYFSSVRCSISAAAKLHIQDCRNKTEETKRSPCKVEKY